MEVIWLHGPHIITSRATFGPWAVGWNALLYALHVAREIKIPAGRNKSLILGHTFRFSG